MSELPDVLGEEEVLKSLVVGGRTFPAMGATDSGRVDLMIGVELLMADESKIGVVLELEGMESFVQMLQESVELMRVWDPPSVM